MPDLRIVHRDGRVEFGEVVTDYDPRYAQMYGELLKQGPGIPLRVEAATLQRVWFVTVDRNCNVQLLKRRAPDLLEALERAGHNYERAGRFGNDEPDDSASELITLGVADLSSRPCAADESGMMLVYPAGVSGSPRPQWDVFLCWLRDRLWDAAWRDVRAKLASSAPGRGHLFIGMTMSTPGDAYFALSDGHRQVRQRHRTCRQRLAACGSRRWSAVDGASSGQRRMVGVTPATPGRATDGRQLGTADPRPH